MASSGTRPRSGIDAVLLDEETADPLYRRCVRVSIGHVLTVPWTRLTSLDEVRARTASHSSRSRPRPTRSTSGELRWPERRALLFGSEGPGLSGEWLAAADVRVRIPMRSGVDSFNVAAAAAVAFYACTSSASSL